MVYRRPFQDVCWAFRSADVRMFMKHNEISYGLSYPEEQHRFIPDFPALQKLCREQKAKNGHIAVVTPLSRLDNFEGIMPPPERVWKSYPGLRTGYAVLLY